MTAEDDRVDVLHRDVRGLGDERPVAGRVEHPGHPHQPVLRRRETLVEGEDDGVERVGDRDDHRLGAVLPDPAGDFDRDLQVDREQLLAAREGAIRARLARHAGGVDDQLGAGERGVVLGADEADVAAHHRQPLEDVEALADRHRLPPHHRLALFRIRRVDHRRRVHEPDLAGEPALGDLLHEHAADETAADDSDLLEHELPSVFGSCTRWKRLQATAPGAPPPAAGTRPRYPRGPLSRKTAPRGGGDRLREKRWHYVLARTGRITIGTPSHCSRRWIAAEVSLCSRPWNQRSRRKTSLPAITVARG
ncbi:MAG: hypothetical protein BWX64_01081 [Acidobacteria bacterium ADurb.Bin051]|nr:MAG: hypothetical protein BWX64_01081 [Acidobacteria bacterium ADurb.Bin051]